MSFKVEQILNTIHMVYFADIVIREHMSVAFNTKRRRLPAYRLYPLVLSSFTLSIIFGSAFSTGDGVLIPACASLISFEPTHTILFVRVYQTSKQRHIVTEWR